MRHLYGTALASVMVAVMFFGGAWGYLRLLKLPVPPGDPGALPADGGALLTNAAFQLSVGAVIATGVLAGVLVALPRISPLAAGLPGLLLVGWTVLYMISVRWAITIIPLRSHAFGAGWEALLFNGILGAVGVAMIVPMCIPSRWRTDNPPAAASRTGRPGGSRAGDRRPRDPWEPSRPSARGGPRPRPGGPSRTTGSFRPATGPMEPVGSPFRETGPIGRVRNTGPAPTAVTGPIRPGTGPIRRATDPVRTTNPIRTTGPIRLKPPVEP